MKVKFKNLIAAAAFIAAGAASAATVTVTTGASGTVYKGHTLSGIEVLTLSEEALSALNAIKSNIQPAGTEMVIIQNADGQFESVKSTTLLSSLKIEDTNDEMKNIVSTNGLTAIMPAQRGVSTGGTVTLTDLDVDIANKKVFARVIGTNGVGTVTHLPLWDIGSIAGSTNANIFPDGTSVNQMVVSGLRLTPEAIGVISTSLGMLPVGKSVVSSVSDFGALAIELTSTPTAESQQGCAMNFKTTKLSATSFDTAVTVVNKGSNAATGWKVNWKYSKPVLLSRIKNAKITDTLEDKILQNYAAQPVSTNATLAPMSATSFSFRGFAFGDSPAVSGLSATLGGQVCTVTTE